MTATIPPPDAVSTGSARRRSSPSRSWRSAACRPAAAGGPADRRARRPAGRPRGRRSAPRRRPRRDLRDLHGRPRRQPEHDRPPVRDEGPEHRLLEPGDLPEPRSGGAGYRPNLLQVGWTLKIIPNAQFDEQTLPEPSELGHAADAEADRRRDRVRGHAVTELTLAAARAAGGDDPIKELPRPLLAWRAEHLGRWRDLEDPTAIEEAHPVRDLAGEAHLVRRDEHRHPVAASSRIT